MPSSQSRSYSPADPFEQGELEATRAFVRRLILPTLETVAVHDVPRQAVAVALMEVATEFEERASRSLEAFHKTID